MVDEDEPTDAPTHASASAPAAPASPALQVIILVSWPFQSTSLSSIPPFTFVLAFGHPASASTPFSSSFGHFLDPATNARHDADRYLAFSSEMLSKKLIGTSPLMAANGLVSWHQARNLPEALHGANASALHTVGWASE